MRKFLKTTGLTIAVLYLTGCTVLYFFQDQIIFNPSKLPEDYVFRRGEEVEINVYKSVNINCLHLKENPSKGVILYLHGTRGHNGRCLRQAAVLEGNGYDVFMPDYRGYGKSEGRIQCSEQILQDVQKVYDYLTSKFNESEIVILGYSLGTGLASHLAANNNPGRLILVAPYISIADLKNRRFPFLPDFLIKYPLNNDQNLREVQCPVTIFHGTSDEVIPFESSLKLLEINPGQIELIKLEGAGHRRTIFHDLLRSSLRRILV